MLLSSAMSRRRKISALNNQLTEEGKGKIFVTFGRVNEIGFHLTVWFAFDFQASKKFSNFGGEC